MFLQFVKFKESPTIHDDEFIYILYNINIYFTMTNLLILTYNAFQV